MRVQKIISTATMFVAAVVVSIVAWPHNAAAANCPCSVWSSGATPGNVSVNNTSSIELGVKLRVDTPGYITGVRFYKAPGNKGTHIGSLWSSSGARLGIGTFTNETTSGWQQLTFSMPVAVNPGVTYVASYFAPKGNYSWDNNYFTNSGADNGPIHALKAGVDGSNGIFSYGASSTFPTSSYLNTNYWVDAVFSPTNTAPSGPILVVTSGSNHFSNYYTEILQNEGYNEYDTADISTVTPALLAQYDVVIVGNMSLTNTQATTLTDWANGGGNMIVMKPDQQLAGLLGITPLNSTLSNQYLKVNTSSGPGAGITNQSIQFHGTADKYSLSGATSVAELYGNANTGTGSPAVTLRSVGEGNGQVAAFTYDLAKSVVYTRQGNPAWSGQNRDVSNTDDVIRSNDMFYGNAPNDPQPDWVDTNKIAIPQADEQQRLLGNLITQMEMDKKPLPHFWYLPNGKKAAVVMTGDDHAVGGTVPRFNTYLQQSPAGCNLAQWECVRATSYIYPSTPITDAQIASFTAQGFEVGVHTNTNCANWTPATIDGFFNTDFGAFASNFPNAPAPVSNRNHCITWSDWDTEAKAELRHGVRFDTNYYHYPPAWIGGKPGFMNGGGFPMRFADTDGSAVDVYQAMTQMTDESGQTYPFTVDSLLDNATSSLGYYGVFTANMHTDYSTSAGSDAIVNSAKNHGVPVVTAKQMLNWLDGRDNSSFSNFTWDGSNETFNVTVGNGAQNLIQAMLPMQAGGGQLQSIKLGASNVSFTIQTIKGIQYAFFPATTGVYTANYFHDNTPPTITSTTPADAATNVAIDTKVKATFSEAMDATTINANTFELRDSGNNLIPASVTYNANTKVATLTPNSPLALNTTYTATVSGGTTDPRVKDAAGNAMATDKTWSFTTSATASIWPSNPTPGNVAEQDASSVEVGIKFRSDVNGFIKGIRFYKSSQNTGSHTGSLWTTGGTRLATGTFSGESGSGWQQLTFTSPVAITANTTYVASYHTNTGYYSADSNFFANSGVDTGPLHALKNGTDGGNGVYLYGAGFPANTYLSTNYWVDVVFSTAP